MKKTIENFTSIYEKCKKVKLEIKGSEYISSITGTFNNYYIDFFKIETNKGN